jgi:hypothetical protein
VFVAIPTDAADPFYGLGNRVTALQVARSLPSWTEIDRFLVGQPAYGRSWRDEFPYNALLQRCRRQPSRNFLDHPPDMAKEKSCAIRTIVS